MVFWRIKGAKPGAAETSDEAAAETDAATNGQRADGSEPDIGDKEKSNVVTLSPSRLSDRLAEVDGDKGAPPALVSAAARTKSADADLPANQSRAVSALRVALAEPLGEHVLVFGDPGTGRRTSALRVANELARDMSSPDQWIYAADAEQTDFLRPFAVPAGEGARLARDANAALERSAAMLDRLMAGDDHRINLDILDEEHRQRTERVFESLKRRAEGQNIALVKTLEGFVLAPMHDGRVVRTDVFRALPEALQRDVEAKLGVLESELQALVVAMPEAELEAQQQLAALNRHVALRAAKPNVAAVKASYAGLDVAAELLELLQNQFVARASEGVRRSGGQPFDAPVCHALCSEAPGATVSEEFGEARGAPVIFARNVSPSDLCGEIGRDASGAPAVRTGHLMQANGGYLIAEAWRLVADGRSWAALSAALETKSVTPETSQGLAVTGAPIPLSIKLVLIADEDTWTRLEAIDPGIGLHFPTIVRFGPREARA